LRAALARRLGSRARISRAEDDAAFDLGASWQHNVQVVVVDLDEHGIAFVRELHEVFADVRIVALGSSERQLRESVKAGATAARLRSTPRARLAELVARLALPPARHATTR
jgi:DNA-binding NarL/FixJ family response regulator